MKFKQRQGDTEALLNEVKKAGYAPTPKPPQTVSQSKLATRAVFDKMTPTAQSEFCMGGGVIVDTENGNSSTAAFSVGQETSAPDLALKLQSASAAIKIPMSFFQAHELAKQLLLK